MSEIRPFRIDVPDAALTDLHRRLDATRWPEQECVDDWTQGVPLAFAQDMVAYWRHRYDWRTREARLNRFDQYLTDDEHAVLAALAHYQEWDSGYAKQQTTRPQTVGYGLVDSPVGQMTWILEKLWAWTDCDGDLFSILGRDELLDNVMLYWLNAAGASSARLYWESFASFGGDGGRVEVPTGVASFPKEIIRSAQRWVEPRYNVTRWTGMSRGGHFAAFEQPELFVDDVREFFATVR